MVIFVDCADPACDALASVTRTTEVEGVDFDGQERTFLLRRIVCAVGHRYDQLAPDLEVLDEA